MSAPRPPVAIRITRPFATVDDFLAHELDTVSRTGVTLVGAQSRPEGVVLRFEIALTDGSPLLRGEGRVVGYKAAALGSEPGLSLRFTRLDSKSKALVDRAAAMREKRRSSAPPPPGARLAPAREDVAPQAPVSDPEPPPDAPPSIPIVLDVSSGELPPDPSVPEDEAAAPDSAPPPVSPPPAAITYVPSPGATEALDRLRERARRIGPEDIARILAEGRDRAAR